MQGENGDLRSETAVNGVLYHFCGTCQKRIPSDNGRIYCTDHCRLVAWAKRQPECQPRRLEFLPTAAGEENHRLGQREAILAALRVRPLTALDLFALGGPGFSSRIRELRVAGHRIVTKMVARHGEYRLEDGE